MSTPFEMLAPIVMGPMNDPSCLGDYWDMELVRVCLMFGGLLWVRGLYIVVSLQVGWLDLVYYCN